MSAPIAREWRPAIGLSSGRTAVPVTEGRLLSHYVGRAYARAIAGAGGVPLVLPVAEADVEVLAEATLATLDGLVLSGGCDLGPGLYGGEEGAALDADPVRDEFESALLRGALQRGLPVLGICRGMELINVHYGGTLRSGGKHPGASVVVVEDLGPVRSHQIRIEPGTLARELFGRDEVEATCVHHQAPGLVGSGLIVSARAEDGSVEAVEDRERDVLGVIWHPELGLDRAPTHRLTYEWIVERARQRQAREEVA